jgi:hypothetical protein
MARPAKKPSVSLRDAFEAVPKGKPGQPCRVCVTIGEMEADEVDTLRELLDSSASSRVIFEACQRAGYERVTLASLRRHRRGECLSLT